MANPKYPLRPLLEHRDRKVDGATAELADAVRAREAAQRDKEEAERVRREAEEAASAKRVSEAARLAEGELRAVDLARAEAWETSVKAQRTELERAADVAGTRRDAAIAAEGAARAELASKMADRDVVAKDERRFDDKTKKRAEAAEEEDAADGRRGRRS